MNEEKQRTRGTGSVFQRHGKGSWYVAFYNRNGEQIQYSVKSAIKAVAEKELRKQLEAVNKGTFVEEARTLKYKDIRTNLVTDYANRSVGLLDEWKNPETGKFEKRIKIAKSLDEFFNGYKVANITTTAINEYIEMRKQDKCGNATINRSLACLRKMMNLAKRSGLLSVVPYFPMLKEDNVREGFVEAETFRAILAEMPEHLHCYLLLLFTSGMRRSAPLGITWNMISPDCTEMTLPARLMKNKTALTLPLDSEVQTLLKTKFRAGQPFPAYNLRKLWEQAVKKVRPGLLVHDLRRSGARALIQAGVPEHVVMKIGGWKTNAMFRRYAIIVVSDMKDAMDKRREKSGTLLASGR